MSKTAYQSSKKVHTLAALGVFCALAYIACIVFHFRVSFLTFDLKDAVMAVGAMIFGPLPGLLMTLVVALLESLTVSTTGLYGFVMNVLSSASFVCVGAAVYQRKRTLSGALLGTGISVIAMLAVMTVANLTITPFYMHAAVDDVAAMLLPLLLPFNLTKGIFNASIVYLIYKPVTKALRAVGFVSPGDNKDGRNGFFSPVTIVALVVAIAALLFFFLYLGGTFSFE